MNKFYELDCDNGNIYIQHLNIFYIKNWYNSQHSTNNDIVQTAHALLINNINIISVLDLFIFYYDQLSSLHFKIIYVGFFV